MRAGTGKQLLLDGWPALLTVVLCLPLLTGSGYPLARDLVFVPLQPWTDAGLGLGGVAPRAVPLDAVVSALSHVVDGAVLARLAVPLAIAAAGWGAHRMVGDLGRLGRLVAGGFAVWNPFVSERLALGQWALLLAYAAVPWLVVLLRRHRESGRASDLGAVVVWLGLASLTPTGGLVALVLVTALAIGRGRAAWVPVGVAAVLQVPWLLPSLVGSAALTSDPTGVSLFAASADGPGGVLVSLLGGGGIWDADSVPVTRGSWWTPAAAVVAVLVIVLGRRLLAQVLHGDLARLGVLAVGGLLLAVAPTLPGGEQAVASVVAHVPGAGLLRDSHKLVLPYVVLLVAATAATAHRVVRRAAAVGEEVVLAVCLAAAALPLVLLPDAASLPWDTVRPVDYPVGFGRAAQVLDEQGPGEVAVLPWRSYRGFAWGNGEVSSDPAVRWFDRPVVVSDDLQVGRRTVSGESARSARIGADLARLPVAGALARNDVGWALVYRDDPEAEDLDLTGLRELYADRDLALYAVPGAGAPPTVGAGERWVVAAGDMLALLVWSSGSLLLGRRRWTVSSRRGR